MCQVAEIVFVLHSAMWLVASIILAVGLILSNEIALGLVCLVLIGIYKSHSQQNTQEDLNEDIASKLRDIGSPNVIDDEPNLVLILWDLLQLCGKESPLIFDAIVTKCQEFIVADEKYRPGIRKEIRKEIGNFGLMAWNHKRRLRLSELMEEVDVFLAHGVRGSDCEGEIGSS